jgi:signal transduction histidine kinase
MESKARRVWFHAGVTLLLATITWIDYVTGYEFGLFVFYSIPVALEAWYGGQTVGLAFAIAAGFCWYLSDRLSLHPYSKAFFIYWETFIRLVSFLVSAVTLSRLRAGLRQRDDLLHVVSHDLRNSLGVMSGQADVLRRQAVGNDFVSARADAILRSVSRMNAIVEDLLDSARTDSNMLCLRMSPVDVRAYLSELVDRAASLGGIDRVRLVLDGGGGLVARADPDRLERIVLNLLSNALKYSPPGSPVDLGAAAKGDWVTISVADRGPGIPSKDLPHVFDRFYRGQQTAARGGLGIGLYSVQLLVKAHGGTVWAEPRCQGGTTFRVALPALSSSQAG